MVGGVLVLVVAVNQGRRQMSLSLESFRAQLIALAVGHHPGAPRLGVSWHEQERMLHRRRRHSRVAGCATPACAARLAPAARRDCARRGGSGALRHRRGARTEHVLHRL